MKIACIIAYDISFVGQTIDILRDVESSIQEYSLLMTRCVVKKRRRGGGKKKKKEYFRYAFPRYYSPYMYIYICCVRGMLVFFDVNLLRNTHSFLYHSQQQQEQLQLLFKLLLKPPFHSIP